MRRQFGQRAQAVSGARHRPIANQLLSAADAPVAITVERTPHIGRLDGNVYFAHGFSGMGVALTGVAGKVIAEAIAGTAERFDVFARLPHTTFHGGKLMRTPMLALAMLWYRMRDWM